MQVISSVKTTMIIFFLNNANNFFPQDLESPTLHSQLMRPRTSYGNSRLGSKATFSGFSTLFLTYFSGSILEMKNDNQTKIVMRQKNRNTLIWRLFICDAICRLKQQNENLSYICSLTIIIKKFPIFFYSYTQTPVFRLTKLRAKNKENQ